MIVTPGDPAPLGARPDAGGTTFGLFSERAERVELCLFDDAGIETRLDVPYRTGHDWHCHVEGVRPGQRYGYRVHGPWDPAQGLLFNPRKLLVDPYARAIDGGVDWDAARVHPEDPSDPLLPDPTDDAAAIPKAIVVDHAFDWQGDRPLRRPADEAIVLELHVRGFTRLMPGVPEELRGTYAGLASDASIARLLDLGVTAVELLPVHHAVDEAFLRELGLTNYWGYSTLGFFAPHAGYAASGTRGGQVTELKEAIRTLHRAGIEVILDVVYNHTAEGGSNGPMLAFKGLDNQAYYRLDPNDPSRYDDVTGTGATLDASHPAVIRLILDSLRHWVTEYHVDGFRFDLASALGRDPHHFDRSAALFDAIHQDPVLARTTLIAEPWDVGEGGYQVGGFPVRWAEWNGRYRDTMRDFWRGHASVADFAGRFTGSSDLFQLSGRRPAASVNYITCHDGFTLRDLVTFEHKRNGANREDNRDGTTDNRNWNCGVEGETDDSDIQELRARQMRNLLATLLLSQGTPMLLAGDERARTQQGNNNAYCQDNDLSWIDWADDERAATQLAFTRRLVALRRAEPVFRRTSFPTGEPGADGVADVSWLRPDGRPMANGDWEDASRHALAVLLSGDDLPGVDGRRPDTFLVLVNGAADPVAFSLGPRRAAASTAAPHPLGGTWTIELSTADPGITPGTTRAARRTTLPGRAVVVLRRLA